MQITDRSSVYQVRSERCSEFHPQLCIVSIPGATILTGRRPTEFITTRVMRQKELRNFMDLFDIFSGQESWHTRRLLELAKTLNDESVPPAWKTR